MTVASEVNKAIFLGSGSTGPFTFGFKFFVNTEISVTKTGTDDVETTLSEGDDYVLTGAGVETGGSVTLTVALESGESIEVLRELDMLQETSFVNQGAFYPQLHEETFDRVVMMIQQVYNYSQTIWARFTDLQAAFALFLFNLNGQFIKTSVSAASFGTDISDAITGIGANNATLIIDSPITVDSSSTIPANISLRIDRPGFLTIATGETLTINGAFAAGLYQVFVGGGTVAGLKEAYPEWFGAIGNDSDNDTAALVKLFLSVESGLIKLTPGKKYVVGGDDSYNYYNQIYVGGKRNLTIDGVGASIRLTEQTRRTFQFTDCENVTVKNMTTYGRKLEVASISEPETIYYMGATADENKYISFDNIISYYNSANIFYIGSVADGGLQSHISIKNVRMIDGHSAMLSYGVQFLTIDNWDIGHADLDIAGGGAADIDIDLQADAVHGDVKNVQVSNVKIHGKGDQTTTQITGAQRIVVGCASGSFIDNVQFNNISIVDVLPNTVVGAGNMVSASSMIIIDNTATRDAITNLIFNNVTTKNSSGIWLQAKNVVFNNLTLDTFVHPSNYAAYNGRAINGSQAVSMGGSQFNNVRILNWANDRSISISDTGDDGGVVFTNLLVKNSAPVWVSDYTIINNAVFDASGNETNGALYLYAAISNVQLSNVVFKNSPYTALKDATVSRYTGGNLTNIKFYNNAVDTDILTYNQNLHGFGDESLTVKGSAWDGPHLRINRYNLWVDATGNNRIKLDDPASGTDGVVIGDQTAPAP